MKPDQWIKDQSIGSSSWGTVYSLTDAHMLNIYGFVFHTSSEFMYLAFEAPGISWEVDLREISNDYGLNASSVNQLPRWIYTIGNAKFVVEFPDPIELQGNLAIKLKSHSGTKSLYRGFTYTGYR